MKKLPNYCAMSGRSARDSVFTIPIMLRTPRFSSQFDDYHKITSPESSSFLFSLMTYNPFNVNIT